MRRYKCTPLQQYRSATSIGVGGTKIQCHTYPFFSNLHLLDQNSMLHWCTLHSAHFLVSPQLTFAHFTRRLSLVVVHRWCRAWVGFTCSCAKVIEWSPVHATCGSSDDGVVFGRLGARVMVAWWRFMKEVVGERKKKDKKGIL